MTTDGFALFETAIGWCGLAWNARGICALQLPQASVAATRARLARLAPESSTPPDHVRRAIERVVALLGGGRVDFADVSVDLGGMEPFDREVYAIACGIPPGETLTYGEIADRLGDRGLAREVGQSLGRNPVPIIVPCHRIVAANGKTGGFSGGTGVATKLRLLAIESVHAAPGSRLL